MSAATATVSSEAVMEHSGLAYTLAQAHGHCGIEYDDLLQEAFIGVFKALRDFEPERNLQPSTYINHKIRGQITHRVRDELYLVRVPSHMHGHLTQYDRAAAALEETLGRLPTFDEVCDAMVDLPESRRELLRAAMKVRRASTLRLGICKQNTSEQCGDAEPLWDAALRDDNTPDDAAIAAEDRRRLRSQVDALPRLQAECIRRRYGLDDGIGRTYKEIGDALGFTREWARQLIETGLERLRQCPELAECVA